MKRDLIPRFVRMFGCDTARISEVGGKSFLILGWNRNTRDDAGQWTRNGKLFNFDYVREQVVASGRGEKQLLASAKKYKKLSSMSWKDVFALPKREQEELLKV